jgi:sensor domain CHASE-containing protein
MIDRVDLLIAVIGIVVSVVGSSTALWMALSKKADKEHLARLESRFETDLSRLETKVETDLARVETNLARVETKLETRLT